MHSALTHEPSEQLSEAHGFYRAEIFAEQIASFFKLSCQRAGIAERPKLPCASQAQTKAYCWIPRSFGQLSNYAMRK